MTFTIIKNASFVQILQDSATNHWLTVSNIDPSVNIYDSMFHKCSLHIQQQIACILATKYPHIKANFFNVNHQSGSNDCGLFAVAFAVSLCHGLQPSKFCFEQQKMRCHLIQCLEKGKMEPFPVRRERRINSTIINSQTIKVFCVCRMPQIGKERMIRCDCWFHGDICINVQQDAWKPHIKWLCNGCPHQ